MKKVILFFLLVNSLFSSSIYTLDNIKNLHLYVEAKADFIGKEDKRNIAKFTKAKLSEAGFVFGVTDSSTIVVKIEAKEIDSTYIINIQLGLAEDVITMRKDDIETLAYTYLSNTMIESDEPYEDTLEYLQFLLYEFIAVHKEDNQE